MQRVTVQITAFGRQRGSAMGAKSQAICISPDFDTSADRGATMAGIVVEGDIDSVVAPARSQLYMDRAAASIPGQRLARQWGLALLNTHVSVTERRLIRSRSSRGNLGSGAAIPRGSNRPISVSLPPLGSRSDPDAV